MKNTPIIILALILNGCFSNGPTENDAIANKLFSIKTENSTYTVSNKFTATITFTNDLGSNVYIINVGCGFPNFILERLDNAKWMEIGAPLCVDVVVAPTMVINNSSFTSNISMNTDTLTQGTYRLRFYIREENMTQTIDSTLTYSNSFMINM